jgi:membrane protein DedA with SNARE-associated domain
MTDFMFFIFTEVFGANLKDAHDIPWETQIIIFPILGLIIGLAILKFIGNSENNDA